MPPMYLRHRPKEKRDGPCDELLAGGFAAPLQNRPFAPYPGLVPLVCGWGTYPHNPTRLQLRACMRSHKSLMEGSASGHQGSCRTRGCSTHIVAQVSPGWIPMWIGPNKQVCPNLVLPYPNGSGSKARTPTIKIDSHGWCTYPKMGSHWC